MDLETKQLLSIATNMLNNNGYNGNKLKQYIQGLEAGVKPEDYKQNRIPEKSEIIKEVMNDLLDNLSLELDDEHPYYDEYHVLKVSLLYKDKLIAKDTINTKNLR